MARRRKEVLSWTPDDNMRATARKVSREYRKLGGKGGAVQKANYNSIKWMERVAAGNLNAKIKAHGRPQNVATGKLARVIKADKSHHWTNRGWKFMVAEKVEAKIPYAYSLEFGYKGNVGKYRWFLFLGGKKRQGADPQRLSLNRVGFGQQRMRTAHPRDVTRSTHPTKGIRNGKTGDQSYLADRIVGRREQTGIRKGVRESKPLKSRYFNREGDWVRVKIKRPIPEYRYGRDAGDRFDQEQIYLTMLENVKVELKKSGTQTELVTGPAAKAKAKSAGTSKARGKTPRKKFPVTVRKIGAPPN